MFSKKWRVLKQSTLQRVFRGTPIPDDQVVIIHSFIWKITIQDMRLKLAIMEVWKKCTSFHPKYNVPPNRNHMFATPVRDFLEYHDKIYYRNTRCSGVKLATIVCLNEILTGVAWTDTRKAILFELRGWDWEIQKVLNRQDSPFETWLRHLEGDKIVAMENTHTLSNEEPRSAQRLFHDLVVPYFGSDPFLRNPARMPSMSTIHPIWRIVELASMTMHSVTEERHEWHELGGYV
jgi:hypothetical protein